MDPLKPLGFGTMLIVLGAIGLTFLGYQERKRAAQLIPAISAGASAPDAAPRGEPPSNEIRDFPQLD